MCLKMMDIYSDTIAEKIENHTGVYLKWIINGDKKAKKLKKAFVSDYYDKESLMRDFIKYERIISYLFERWHRENRTPGNA